MPQPDAIPHPSHRSTDSWSAGGLCECWPHDARPTLSTDIRKPFRRTLRTSVTPTWPRSRGSLVVDPAGLSEVEVGPREWAGLSNVGRKGRLRVSPHERYRTGASPQPSPARLVLERVRGDRLRLAAPSVRPTRIPRGQTRPVSTVGCRPLDRRSDRVDFSGQSMSLAGARGMV